MMSFRSRRSSVAASVLVILATSLTLAACSVIHDSKPKGAIQRATESNILAEVNYAKAHFKNPNTSEFGNLGGTDCVNFMSQNLLARGWKQTADWSHKRNGSNQQYTRAWISSTGFHDYMKQHPELGTELKWSQRSQVSVGDVVQFDWDASGDRDHTAIVSGLQGFGTNKVILLASHSPAAFDWPIQEAIAEHGQQTKVYFWHLY
jgi:hypothetical protein